MNSLTSFSDKNRTIFDTIGLNIPAADFGKLPRLSEFSASAKLPKIDDLISQLLKHPAREELLASLADEEKLIKFLNILLRSRNACRELLIDQARQAESFPEFFGELSLEERSRLDGNTDFLSRVYKKICEAGFAPNRADVARQITRDAGLPRENTAFSYDILSTIQTLSEDLRFSTALFEKYSDGSLNSSYLARYSIEPILSTTESNSYPGRLLDWTYKTYTESKSASGLKSFWVFTDAPYGLVIKRDDIPQALLSFSTDVQCKFLRIEQMQGLKGVACSQTGEPLSPESPRYFSNKLYGIAFRELFVDITERIAILNNCDGVQILGGKNNLWVKPNRWKAKPGYSIEAASRAYDEVAQQKSYTPRTDGNWEWITPNSGRLR
jgi:hypothetical protein